MNFLAYEDNDKNHKNSNHHKTISVTIPNVVRDANIYIDKKMKTKSKQNLICLLKNGKRRKNLKNYFIQNIYGKNINNLGFHGSNLFQNYKWNLNKFRDNNYYEDCSNSYYTDGYYQKKYYINKSVGDKYIYKLCPYPMKGN